MLTSNPRTTLRHSLILTLTVLALVAALLPGIAYAATVPNYTITDFNGTYDGAPHSIAVSVEDGYTVTYSEVDGGSYSPGNIEKVAAGTYPVYVCIQNERDPSETYYDSGQIVIAKKSVTFQLIYKVATTRYNTTFSYGDPDPDPNSLPRITGLVAGEQLEYTVTIEPYKNPANEYSLPGSRKVSLSMDVNQGANRNYAISFLNHNGTSVPQADINGTITYLPRPLTIYTPNLTIYYGDAAPTLSDILQIDGLVAADLDFTAYPLYGINAYLSLIQFLPSGNPARLMNMSSGEYAAAQALQTGQYYIQYNINNPGIPAGYISTKRYNSYAGYLRFCTILPKPVTITALNMEKFAGDADPAFKSTITDTAYGETISFKLERDPGETPGTYAIRIVVDDANYPNYDISTVVGTLTVKARPATPPASSPLPAPPSGATPASRTPSAPEPFSAPENPSVPEAPQPLADSAVEITENSLPTAARSEVGGWALANLICTLIGGLIFILLVLRARRSRLQNNVADGRNQAAAGQRIARMAAILPGPLMALLLILFENYRLPMVFINRLTCIIAPMLIAQLLLALLRARAARSTSVSQGGSGSL